MAGKQTKNRYSKNAVRQQMIDAVGGTEIIYTVEDADGKEIEFTIPHPLFYPRATKDALKELDDTDEEGVARLVLGDQYDRFVEVGGEDEDISMLMARVQKDSTARINGRPTR